MNTFFQIAIGLSPAVIVFAIMAFTRKTGRAQFAAAAVAAGICAGSFAIGGAVNTSSHENAAVSSTKGVLRTEENAQSDILGAYAFASGNSTKMAKQVIDSSSANTVYTEDRTLALARLAVISGNLFDAKALYAKLPDSVEKNAVMAASPYYAGNSAEIKNVQSIVNDEISKTIADSDVKSSQNYAKAAQIAAYAEKAYDDFAENNFKKGEKQAEAGNMLKELEAVMNSEAGIKALSPVRDAALKLRLIEEDYAGIAANLDENSSYTELMIASELYLNGHIRAEDFSEEFRKGNGDRFKVVVDTMEKVYDQKYSKKPDNEKKAILVRIEELKRLTGNPSMLKTETALDRYAADPTSDSSKIYLQIAKIENHMGNERKSSEYIDKSISNAGNSSDSKYSGAMSEIVSIISDKSNAERLKDVPKVTDKIIESTLPLDIKPELKKDAPESSTKPGSTSSSSSSSSSSTGGISTGRPPETQEPEPVTISFKEQFSSHVSKKRMAINIVDVDSGDMGCINVHVTLTGDVTATVEELKEMIKVTDCSINIENYTFEKVEYAGANILMCVDVSGSMKGKPITDLKAAVKQFVETASDVESVALVTFNSEIVDVYTFGTPNSELISAAEALKAGGNTDIYKAVKALPDYFTKDPTKVNSVILMSDGQGGRVPQGDELREEITEPYAAKGITLYSIGLGSSVDAYTLSTFADATGGNYVYADTSSVISNVFGNLRAQALNVYKITFSAEEKEFIRRKVRIELVQDSFTFDEYIYFKNNGVGINIDEWDEDYYESWGIDNDKTLYGFSPRKFYRSDKSDETDNVLSFMGENFSASDVFSISLKGRSGYNFENLTAQFVSENEYKVTVPYYMTIGTYDAEVTINGKTAKLNGALVCCEPGTTTEAEFGDYKFTADKIYTDENSGVTTMQGNVTMNGWLHFKGDVTLRGDPDGDRIVLNTEDSEFVKYSKKSAEGIAKIYANLGLDAELPALKNVTLRRDGDVEAAVVNTDILIPDFLTLSTPGIELYPDKVHIEAKKFTTKLPMQELVEKPDGLPEIFRFEVDAEATFSANRVDIKAEVGRDDRKIRNKNTNTTIGALKAIISAGEFELKIDSTPGEEYIYIKLGVKLPMVTEKSELELETQWTWKTGFMMPDMFKITTGGMVDVTVQAGPVTLTFDKFHVEIENLSSIVGNFAGFADGFDFSDFINSDVPRFGGGCEISAWELGAIPGLEGIDKIVGAEISETSVLSADVAFSFGLMSPSLKASATIKSLGFIELSKVELELGVFNYSESLLGISEGDAFGIRVSDTQGIKVELPNLELEATGTVEVALTNKGLVLPKLKGQLSVNIMFFIWPVCKVGPYDGEALLGVKFLDGEAVFMATVKLPGGNTAYYAQYSTKDGGKTGEFTI